MYHTKALGNTCDKFEGFVLVAVVILLFHIAVNTISDYRDFKKGIDTEDSLGSSGMLVKRLVDPKKVYYIGLTSLGIGSIIGIVAAFLITLKLLFAGIIAVMACYFYSEPPLGYKYKAFGELAVFIIFGPLLFIVCGIALLDNTSIDFLVNFLLLSVASGILTVLVLLSNNLRDYEYDKAKSNTTLVSIIGLKYGYGLFFSLIHLVFLLSIFFSCWLRIFPITGLLVFSAYPLVFLAVKRVNQKVFVEYFVWLDLSYSLIAGSSMLYHSATTQ
jgi:1,4-dihydroxy-2-naphthoate octaprenyltransferase